MRTGATYIPGMTGYAPGLFRLSGGLVERYPLRLSHSKTLLGKVSQNQLTGNPLDTDKSALSSFQRGQHCDLPHERYDPSARIVGWYDLRHSSPARMQEETPKPGQGKGR